MLGTNSKQKCIPQPFCITDQDFSQHPFYPGKMRQNSESTLERDKRDCIALNSVELKL